MAYYKESQKKYKEKIRQYKVQYGLQDQDGERVKAYLEQTGQSANSYIKALIEADLDAKGFCIDDNTSNIDNTDSHSQHERVDWNEMKNTYNKETILIIIMILSLYVLMAIILIDTILLLYVACDAL